MNNDFIPHIDNPSGDLKNLPILRGLTEIRPIWDIVYNNGGVIAGGYARYCLSPKKNPVPAGDVDVFPIKPESYEALVEKIGAKFNKAYENDVSMGFRRSNSRGLTACPTIQVIKPRSEGRLQTTGSIEHIIRNFDFTVVRAALVDQKMGLVDKDFEEDEVHMKLHIKNIHCPIGTSKRVARYVQKGYSIREFEILKLFVDWMNREDEYRLKIIDLLNQVETNINKSDEFGNRLRLSDEDRALLYRLMRVD